MRGIFGAGIFKAKLFAARLFGAFSSPVKFVSFSAVAQKVVQKQIVVSAVAVLVQAVWNITYDVLIDLDVVGTLHVNLEVSGSLYPAVTVSGQLIQPLTLTGALTTPITLDGKLTPH